VIQLNYLPSVARVFGINTKTDLMITLEYVWVDAGDQYEGTTFFANNPE
jgi:hypothetical protein